MIRTAGWVSAWMAAVVVSCVVGAQEPSAERRAPHVSRPKALEQIGADARGTVTQRDGTATNASELHPAATDRVGELARTKIKVAPRIPAGALAGLGARAPFDYSAQGKYLVAGVRDDDGLALWETASRKRLRRLEDSERPYSLVAISDDARWIAAVRQDDNEQVDLWRADNGRHVRVIHAAGGPKSKLEFEVGNPLHIVAANGDEAVFSVPSGVAIGGSGGRQTGSALKRHSVRIESPNAPMPAAPWTTRAMPPARPPVNADREAPTLAHEPPQAAAPNEPPLPRAAAPRMAMSRKPRAAATSPAAADEPAAMAPSEPAGAEAPTSHGQAQPGAAAPAAGARQFHFEMVENPAAETEHAAAEAMQPTVEAPPAATVSVNFATNRNRLASKDRAWMVYFRGFFASAPAFVIYVLTVLSVLILPWFGKRSWAASAVLIGSVTMVAMGVIEACVRSQLRNEMTGELYGCRPADLSYGTCEISVPPPQNRRPGDISRPFSLWIFEAPENPEKHFMLCHVEEHKDKDAFYRSLSAQLERTDARAAMVFIHGYNVSFEDAIFRTAQLAVDLKFPGAPIAFCWPSYADPVKYPFDEQNAEVSIPALREVLEDLAARSGAKRIHIIAHSMGNRVLAGALRSMEPAAQARNKEAFRELVLAAPDIDSRVFQSQVLPYIASNTQHCTLYASSRDRALLMSRCFHNYQRLGEATPELLIANGLDTIDASLVDTSLLGHSYIGDVQSIVSDLHDLVVAGKRAAERHGLEGLERNALKYWSIKPQLQTAAEENGTGTVY